MRPLPIFKIKDTPDAPDLNTQIEDYLNQELLARLEIIKISPKKILILGDNLNLKNLLQIHYPKSEIILLSPSSPAGRTHKSASTHKTKTFSFFKMFKSPKDLIASYFTMTGSFNDLPFIKNSFDLIVSNLHIFNSDLKKSLPELSRTLKKDGLLMLTLPGPDTFLELRQAMAHIDSHTHIPIFLDMHELGDLLVKAKFKDPVIDSERFVLNLKNLKNLLKSLKNIKKFKNIKLKPDPNFSRFLYTPRKFNIFKNNYLTNFQGEYPVQFEITFAHAWGTDPQQIIDPEGYARVSLEGLKDSLRKESFRSPPDK